MPKQEYKKFCTLRLLLGIYRKTYFLEFSAFCRVFKDCYDLFRMIQIVDVNIFCKSGNKVFILGICNIGTQHTHSAGF